MLSLPEIVIPLIIFFARIADVSIGTLRITMVSRGYKIQSALLGFFEVLIWVIVVAQILSNLDSWINYVAYAAGFSTGTYVGLYIEDKLKVGTSLVRIITLHKSEEIISQLNQIGVAITSIEGKGSYNDVTIIFSVIKRKRVDEVFNLIKDIDSEAFFSAEDVKYSNKHHDHSTAKNNHNNVNRLLSLRKSV